MKNLLMMTGIALLAACGLPDKDTKEEGRTCSIDNKYGYQDECQNEISGGCSDSERPTPTYSNTLCDYQSEIRAKNKSVIFTWCCIEGRYISEKWEYHLGGCWELTESWESEQGEGICY